MTRSTSARLRAILALLATTTACGEVLPIDADAVAAPDDGALDAAPRCDRHAVFGKPEPVSGLDPARAVSGATLSADELTLYLASKAGAGRPDLQVTTRASREDRFGPLVLLPGVNGTTDETWPAVTADGLTIYFDSNRLGTSGAADLYLAERAGTAQSFGMPVRITALDSSGADRHPFVLPAGDVLYYASDHDHAGALDLYRAKRAAGGFGAAQLVEVVDTVDSESNPVLTPDELTLYFHRAGDVFVARRDTIDARFSPPVRVGELDSHGDDIPAWVSADECRLYVISNHLDDSGVYQLGVASRPPP